MLYITGVHVGDSFCNFALECEQSERLLFLFRVNSFLVKFKSCVVVTYMDNILHQMLCVTYANV